MTEISFLCRKILGRNYKRKTEQQSLSEDNMATAVQDVGNNTISAKQLYNINNIKFLILL